MGFLDRIMSRSSNGAKVSNVQKRKHTIDQFVQMLVLYSYWSNKVGKMNHKDRVQINEELARLGVETMNRSACMYRSRQTKNLIGWLETQDKRIVLERE